MNDEKKIQEIEARVKAFHKTQSFVHVSTFADVFYNGTIKEVSAEFMIFADRFDGDTLIFFREIKKIDFYKKELEK
jgi:hypothetical protein